MFNLKSFMNGQHAHVPVDGGYDHVQFAGILCKAEFDNGGGKGIKETKYFVVDPNGKATNCMNGIMWGNPVFKIETPEESVLEYNPEDVKFPEFQWSRGHVSNTDNPIDFPKEKVKPEVVEVMRHFRRWDYAEAQVSSRGGLSAFIRLNYRTNMMQVFPSFCSDEDNFSKDIGTRNAKQYYCQGHGVEIQFDKEESIYSNLAKALHSRHVFWVDPDMDEAIKCVIRLGFERLMDTPSERVSVIF